MNERLSVDSNVLLYAIDEVDSPKKVVALELLRNVPTFSSQALSEVINVCRKRWKYDKQKLVGTATFLLNNAQLTAVDASIVRAAHELIFRYDFQYFDALIVATALAVDSEILYTEDLQHGHVVEGRLTLLNPFR